MTVKVFFWMMYCFASRDVFINYLNVTRKLNSQCFENRKSKHYIVTYEKESEVCIVYN